MVLMPVNWLNSPISTATTSGFRKAGSRTFPLSSATADADGSDFGVSDIPAIDAGQEVLGLSLAAILHQPARAFRNKQQRQQEKYRGHRGRGEHPAPVRRASSGETIIHAVGQQNARDDRQLVDAHHQSTNAGRRNFCDVKRRKCGS